MKPKILILLLLIALFTFLSIADSFAASWGTIVSPNTDVTVREKRSKRSKAVDRIKAGQHIKVDFLKKDWFAVFSVKEKRRNEDRALGYVYAPHLYRPAIKSSELTKKGKKPADKKSTALTGREKTPADKKTTPFLEENVPIEIKKMNFKIEKDGREFFIIEFNCPYVPAMYRIQGEKPRIVLDITNVSSFKQEWATISTDGKLIKQIRSTINPDVQMVRIVLYMDPSKDCSIHPFFNGEDSIYFLEISEENKQFIPLPR